MARIATGGVIGPLPLNRQAAPPLYRQLYEDLRSLILSGRLAPATAALDAAAGGGAWGVAQHRAPGLRSIAERGYIESRRGAGSFVSRDLPNRPARPMAAPTAQSPRLRDVSSRGRRIVEQHTLRKPVPAPLRRAGPM
jgi:GntR family transcriptional regulator/MocR family aminotransferase